MLFSKYVMERVALALVISYGHSELMWVIKFGNNNLDGQHDNMTLVAVLAGH